MSLKKVQDALADKPLNESLLRAEAQKMVGKLDEAQLKTIMLDLTDLTEEEIADFDASELTEHLLQTLEEEKGDYLKMVYDAIDAILHKMNADTKKNMDSVKAKPSDASEKVDEIPASLKEAADEEDEDDEDDDSDDDMEDDEESDDKKEDCDKEMKESFDSELQTTIDSVLAESLETDMSALFGGETLTEDFKAKAVTIFEAAVAEKSRKVSDKMKTIYEQAYESYSAYVVEELNDQIDQYMDYVVEQFMAENKLAVEAGIRTEIAEQFMTGLKGLLEEHDVFIPKAEEDMVIRLADKVETLEAQLDEQLNLFVKTKQELVETKKQLVVKTLSEDLTASQAVKLQELAEGVSVKDISDFTKQVKTLKESYFPVDLKPAVDEPKVLIEEVKTAVVTDPLVQAAIDFNKRHGKQ